jgi:tellurite resistance protein TerB
MLAAMKEKLSGALSKLNGRTDFLEAVCASAALVASADGEVSDDEIKNTIKVVTANPALTKAFKQAAIEKCIDAMLKRAASGRTGRAGLYKEIEDVRADSAVSELVYLAAVDIAETDGNIASKEQDVLNLIAQKLSVNPNVANV